MIFLNPKTILGALASASLISGGTAFVPSWKNAPRVGAMGELRAVMSVPPEGIVADKMNAFLTRCEEEETKCALELEERKAAILNEFIEKEREDILQEVEEMAAKKDLEIQTLKQQLDDLVAQQQQKEEVQQEEETTEEPIVSADPTVLALSKEELIDKVKSYQALVSKYMEDAAQQQARAVQVAEDTLTQKYEAQLKALGYVEPPKEEETSSNEEASAPETAAAAEDHHETSSETEETKPELVQSIESAATADLHQAPPPSAPEKTVVVSSISPLPQIQPDKFLRNA